jgi:tetratricopeptide (TPR) repeat protein
MALSEYARAIEIDPDFSPAYNMIGYTQVQLGNHEAAAVAFREYIRLIPDDPNPYDSYAEMLMKMGRFDESMDMYREAISKDSSFSASYLGVAGNLNLLDRHPEAREFLQNLFDAPNTRDHRTQAFYAIAVSFVDEGKLESALTVLEHCCDSLRTRQDIVSLANNLHDQGFILIEMQQFEKALRKFEEALNLIENTDLADEVVEGYQRANLLRAANVALKQKKFDLAREKLKEWETLAEAMNLPRWREHSHLGKGMIAMEDGDFDRAVTEIRQSNLSRVHNLFQLALAYDGQGATSLARDYYLRAARYHAPCSLEYAMVRKKALARADELSLQ